MKKLLILLSIAFMFSFTSCGYFGEGEEECTEEAVTEEVVEIEAVEEVVVDTTAVVSDSVVE